MLDARDKLKLIQNGKTLRQLIEACPDLWQETGTAINQRLGDLAGKTGATSGEKLQEFIAELTEKSDAWMIPLQKSSWNLGMVERAFPDLIKARMARLALHNYFLGALAGKGGKIRFNWWNGTVLQRLLFQKGFERKPVSLFWYNLVWPFISQKKILMRLVYKKGIYCFYSRELIRGIAALVLVHFKASPNHQVADLVLEVAAGDGTLSRFLKRVGLNMSACDDYSWEATAKVAHSDVERIDAVSALKKYRPAVVVCSWPPANNSFEKEILAAAETQVYIVIGSRLHFASGDRQAYARAVGSAERPGDFQVEFDARLTNQVLPHELDNEVLVFRRRRAAEQV